jgi:hypothetical protein
MNLSRYKTNNYGKYSSPSPMEKRTQTNPILPATPFGGQVLTAVPLEVKVLQL